MCGTVLSFCPSGCDFVPDIAQKGSGGGGRSPKKAKQTVCKESLKSKTGNEGG